jgi:hypothetical protein
MSLLTRTLPPLTYSATGLPPRLSVNSSTGLISGTPTTAVGENYATFQESRSATFARLESFKPAQFKELATDDAPYGDDNGQSSDISVTNPQYLVVAVGW